MLLRYRLRNFNTSKSFATILTTHRQLFTSTTANIMSNRAAFVESAKGQIIVRDAETVQPEAKEVLIKVQACAIQPADSKVAKLAIMPMEYPAVLGSPVAGIVEAIGADVTKVAVGDRIVCGTKVFVAKKAKYGGLQRFSVVDESEVVEVSICIAVIE